MTTHTDPTLTDPDLYVTVFENEHVRVLEYRDSPGDRTHPHAHPDSVMITLSAFDRRLISGERSVEVHKEPHEVGWLPAQTHAGENVGGTATHAIFVELKHAGQGAGTGSSRLGPDKID